MFVSQRIIALVSPHIYYWFCLWQQPESANQGPCHPKGGDARPYDWFNPMDVHPWHARLMHAWHTL